jgi:hypothetical protein
VGAGSITCWLTEGKDGLGLKQSDAAGHLRCVVDVLSLVHQEPVDIYPGRSITKKLQHDAFKREHDAFKREHDELKREHDELKRDFTRPAPTSTTPTPA